MINNLINSEQGKVYKGSILSYNMKKGVCKVCGEEVYRNNHLNGFVHCRLRQLFDNEKYVKPRHQDNQGNNEKVLRSGEQEGIKDARKEPLQIQQLEVDTTLSSDAEKTKKEVVSSEQSQNEPTLSIHNPSLQNQGQERGASAAYPKDTAPVSAKELEIEHSEPNKQAPEAVKEERLHDFQCSSCFEFGYLDEMKENKCLKCGEPNE